MAGRENLDVVLGEGAPVFTSDGRVLGHVREIDFDQEQFKVDIPNEVDLWIEFSHISSTATGYLRLALSRNEVMDVGRVQQDRSLPHISARGTDLEQRSASRQRRS